MIPENSRFLDPKNDFAFKRIFGREENKDILLAFLNDVLENHHAGNIVDVEFLPTIQEAEAIAQKESLLDILCKDQDGTRYIVEMQVARTDHFLKRAQYYAAKAYGRQLRSGQEYETLKEVIFLAIVDFDLFSEKGDTIKSDHIILDRATLEHNLRDFRFIFIELPKFKKTIDELESNTDRWYYYLKHAQETIGEVYEKMIAQAPVMERAYKELDKAYWSEAEMNTYDGMMKKIMDAESKMIYQRKEGRREGREEGRKEGVKEGKTAKSLEIAQQMLAKGYPVAEIQTLTGLSAEEVQPLKK